MKIWIAFYVRDGYTRLITVRTSLESALKRANKYADQISAGEWTPTWNCRVEGRKEAWDTALHGQGEEEQMLVVIGTRIKR